MVKSNSLSLLSESDARVKAVFQNRKKTEAKHPWVDEGEPELVVARGMEGVDLACSTPKARKFQSVLMSWLLVHQTRPP
jgi:hypothetical protein